jgi:tetratricopeptide (TPR) repeat protein
MAGKCQQCGAFHPAEELVKGEICPTCDGPYQVKSYKTVAAMPPPQVNKYIATIQTQLAENPGDKQLNGALGICFLKLKLHAKALPFFEKAMEDNFADPNPYFYAAVCLLKGKKAFLSMRPDIESMERYLDAAISLEPRADFYYFQAYIKCDYYERKDLDASPSSQELLETAKQNGLTEEDITSFYELLGVERPEGI